MNVEIVQFPALAVIEHYGSPLLENNTLKNLLNSDKKTIF